jgi:hypothetical protein
MSTRVLDIVWSLDNFASLVKETRLLKNRQLSGEALGLETFALKFETMLSE